MLSWIQLLILFQRGAVEERIIFDSVIGNNLIVTDNEPAA
jgi:hypothetical protein